MILTTDKMDCACDFGPRKLDIGEGTVYCGVCGVAVSAIEKINPEIATNAMNQQARINELLTEILRLQAQVYRLTQSLNQLDPR